MLHSYTHNNRICNAVSSLLCHCNFKTKLVDVFQGMKVAKGNAATERDILRQEEVLDQRITIEIVFQS